MSGLLQDVRFGARTLRRRPGFTAVVALTLALGIGANTAIFSVVNAVLFRPLPYEEPERLVLLRHDIESTGFFDAPLPPPEVADLIDETESFQGVAATNRTFEANLTGDGLPEEIRVASVTSNYFDVLGVRAGLGRTFVPEDAEPFPQDPDPDAPPPVNNVVISQGLWWRHFGGDAEVIGKPIVVNGFTSTVVGVMPGEFRVLMPANAGMPTDIDMWMPMRFDLRAVPRSNANANLRVIARLAPGVTVQQAREEIDNLSARFREEYEYNRAGRISIAVKPLRADIVGHVRHILFTLLGAVAFVLLIACANVAGLLLVRASSREKEIAIRAALGGNRRRIVRQMLTESAILALLGGLAGLLLARWGIDLLLALRPANLPRVENVTFDSRVLLFTLGATIGAAFLFGLVPALQSSRPDLQNALKDRGSVSPNVRRRRVRSLLVVGEMALSMVLLIGAGLMLRGFVALQRADLGFVPQGVQTFRLSLPFQKYQEARERAEFYAELESGIAAMPGVKRVGSISVLPLTGRFWTSPFATKDSEEDGWSVNEANYRFVTPGYLPAMRTRVLEGRMLTEADNRDSTRIAVVDEAMAERAWPGKDPIGQWLQVEIVLSGAQDWVEVVGVVENVRWDDPAKEDRPTIYFPHFYQAGYPFMNVAVRADADPTAVVGMVRELVSSMDPELPVAGVRTMDSYVAEALAPIRFTMILIAIFAAAALLLATVGLYGVISSSVKQRTREIGVHMAFGADRSRILRMVLRRGLTLSATGILVGLLASVALSRVFERTLTGVTAMDPATFAAVAGLLTVVALVASFFPAHRATRVDPMVALRYE